MFSSRGSVVLVALFSCFLASVVTARRCRVVALSGGGDKGAYEAGVLNGLIKGLQSPEAQWDVVTGISAGSINLGGLISYPIGSEDQAAEFLVNTAESLTKSDIYHNWPLGILQGLFESGLYNTDPLAATLKRLVGGPYYRRFVVGATSYYSGNLVVWNETFSDADVLTGMRASAAIPGIFEAVKARNDLFGDGGVKEGVNILDGITRCLEITSDLKEISVDVVLAMGYGSIKPEDVKGQTLPLLLRAYDIMRFKSSLDRIDEAQRIFPPETGLDFRYLIYPNASLPGVGLEFNKAEMTKMVEIGQSDAKIAIEKQKSGGWNIDDLKEVGKTLHLL
eukprot:g1782.t1